MALETACEGSGRGISLPLSQRANGVWQSDWEPLIRHLGDAGVPVGQRAADFHASLALAILDQARALRAVSGVSRIGLAGGVFQNRVLCERVLELAHRHGFEAFTSRVIPCNDAGISFGQLVEVAAAR